jgi:prepilin-type N-terminal cleavage/methylation domain-containing protein
MNRVPKMRRRLRARPGFTLIELMITAVLMGLIGTMLTTVLVRQQRFHRAVAALTDARARMRDIETIVPTDLRGISTIAGDIFAYDVNSFQFRAFVGASVLCAYTPTADVIELPPKTMVKPSGDKARGEVINEMGTVLSAWINPPQPSDVAFLYDDGTESGNADDGWTMFTISDTASSADFAAGDIGGAGNQCLSTNETPIVLAGDDATPQRRYRLKLSSAPTQTRNKVGAPIRFGREVRYSGYQGSDGNWYVGYQTCVPSGTTAAGTCGTREVLAGPILPVTTDTTTSGIYFVAYNQAGTRVTQTTDVIAWVSVGIRTTSESLRRSTGSSTSIAGGDSLKFVIGIRNRI